MIELVERKLAERYNIHGAHKFAEALVEALLAGLVEGLLEGLAVDLAESGEGPAAEG